MLLLLYVVVADGNIAKLWYNLNVFMAHAQKQKWEENKESEV